MFQRKKPPKLGRLHAYSFRSCNPKHAPQASDTAMNEAVRRLSGYLFDQPETSRSMTYANALRNSGAAGDVAALQGTPPGAHGDAQ